jgi:predicted ArsR family transcriptional regulator
MLPEYPVTSAATAAAALDVSDRSCRDALAVLAEVGIVQPFHPASRPAGRPRHWWVANELVDLVTAWSR